MIGTSKDSLRLADRIGVSTLCLKGFTPQEGIECTLAAGFRAFEFTPITYGGPNAFNASQREALRNQLEAFQRVTVHSSSMGNIASDDPAERDQAREQYRELVRFANDVGAGVVTAHPGQPEPKVFKENVAVGKQLVGLAEGSDMSLGFELFDVEVARSIGSANFGALFDIGHATCRGLEIDTEDVLGMIDEMADQIVQFHVHGVGAPNKTDHLPFADNTWLDYELIMQHIEGIGLNVPMILEIGIRGTDGHLNLRDCIAAKNALVAAVAR